LTLSATDLHPRQDEEQEGLGALLKRCRARIAAEKASLGPYLRLPVRVGKVVSQEEVAEAAGISRQWYGLMERDGTLRVSAGVLTRIADVLMMDEVERAALFRLALPELRSTFLTDRSTTVLDALGSVRRLTRRLLAASSESEALTLVREYAMAQFAPDVMLSATRIENGRWEFATTGDVEDRVQRFLTLFMLHVQQDGVHVPMMEDLYAYTLMAQPGELVTRAERDAVFPDLDVKVRDVLEAIDWSEVSFTLANVRSQGGFVARLVPLYHTAHASSPLERAELSTLADLTSLALSGYEAPARRMRAC
jgi:transcriptional regulator with XRE-family HTH domain